MKSNELETAVSRVLELAEYTADDEKSPRHFCELKTSRSVLQKIFQKLKKLNQIYRVKTGYSGFPLIISLEGGTGTGKSTIFNALIGRQVSLTGSERPKTFGPLLFCHLDKKEVLLKTNLLPDYEKKFLEPLEENIQLSGDPHRIRVIFHNDGQLKDFFLFDTPDIDSVETFNRDMAEDIYDISDIIIFVTSQEKYGDRIPFKIFKQAISDRKRFLVVMNKVDSSDAFTELRERVKSEAGGNLGDNYFFDLPWATSDSPFEELIHHEQLHKLKEELFSVKSRTKEKAREEEIANLERRLLHLATQLVQIFEKERETIDELAQNFRTIYDETRELLLKKSVGRLDETTKQHIQNEIRQIFRRYDLLRKPRSFIYKIVRFPLSFLGILPGSDEERRKKDLARLHRKIDLSPLHMAINDLNRKIHNEIRITGIEYLQKAFLYEDFSLTPEEIDNLFFDKQKQLEEWLQSQFLELTKGIPRHKEWGIYSTTVLWSIFLISIETVVGGGLSMFEAILDSVIMPFISKGAVEIFAYQELKNIAEKLDRRYREQLLEVLEEQYKRYMDALERCAISRDDLTKMKNLISKLQHQHN